MEVILDVVTSDAFQFGTVTGAAIGVLLSGLVTFFRFIRQSFEYSVGFED